MAVDLLYRGRDARINRYMYVVACVYTGAGVIWRASWTVAREERDARVLARLLPRARSLKFVPHISPAGYVRVPQLISVIVVSVDFDFSRFSDVFVLFEISLMFNCVDFYVHFGRERRDDA